MYAIEIYQKENNSFYLFQISYSWETGHNLKSNKSINGTEPKRKINFSELNECGPCCGLMDQ